MSAVSTPAAVPAGNVKPRGRVRAWIRRALRNVLIALFVIAVVGAIYERLAERADARAYPPPGQMVDVGGRDIHVLVTGSETGRPTVILEAGVASFSSNWARVQDALAGSTRVVSYDRAGLGWSDAAPETHDVAQSAADLHAALQVAGIDGPYVVVGHSYGGLAVRAFADLYPQDVVGMVLVDASHPDQWADVPIPAAAAISGLFNRAGGVLAGIGVVRVLGWDASLSAGLPPQQAGELEAALARPGSWLTSGAVIGIWDSRSRPIVHAAADLGDLPLAVISAPERPDAANLAGYADLLNAQQAELAGLSSNSLRLIVDGATHESLVNEAAYAQVVADGILQVIQAAETGQPVSAP